MGLCSFRQEHASTYTHTHTHTNTNTHPTQTHFLAVVENYRALMHACMVMGAMERGNGLFVVSC